MKLMRAFLPTILAAGAFAAASTWTAFAVDIAGAGATFPYPIYAKWADAYNRETNVRVNYQSIGSGGGIQQIEANTVVFGGTDAPLSGPDLDKNGLVQFPMVVGGIVPVVNLDGVSPGTLLIDGPTLAKIFLGKVKTWDDAALKALNPDVKLPSQAIAVVHRSDGSGTTFNFTDYLSKVSPDWKSSVGSATAVEWPAGIGAKGNEGVAANVAQTKGSIGYVEYAYARQNKLTFTKMVNKDGKTIMPTYEAFQAAAANADWNSVPGFGVILSDQPGAQSWPMTAATFILIHKHPQDLAAAGEALKFIAWAYAKGGKMAEELDYIAMPMSVVGTIEKVWAANIKDAGGRPLFTAPSTVLVQAARPSSGSVATAVNAAGWMTEEATGQWRARKMIGLNVYNNDNEKIGDIAELILDRSGKVEAVVVGAGGFLGLGEHDVAVPYSQISWVDRPVTASSTSTTTTGAGSRTLGGQRGTFADGSSEGPRSYPDHGVLNMTKDQLKAAPAFAFSR
jgi:phosphate transport system substrate-binding protein